MKKYLFLLFLLPAFAQGQTWQKAWDGAQKALLKPGSSSLERSRQALQKARQQLQVSDEGIRLWLDRRHSPVVPAHSSQLEAWAWLSNRLMLKEHELREQQIQFFQQHSHGIEPGALAYFAGRPADLPARMGENIRFVVVGAKKGEGQALVAFKKMAAQYRAAFPERKVIILAQSLPDRGVRFVSETAAPEEQKGFVRSLIQDRFAVGGLGDPSAKPKGYVTQDNSNLLISSAEVPASEAARSFHMRRRLAEWKKDYPQAVFFVYVSPLAAAYDWKFSLVNGLAEQEVFAVSITSVRNTRDFLFHRWRAFQEARPGMLLWQKAPWARMSGFDAQLILP